MHPKYTQTLAQVIDWAGETPDVRGVVVIGSQARSQALADEWSDLDLMVLVDDPRRWMADNDWFARFGEVVCFFDEIVPVQFGEWNWTVKRALYTDRRDVDFSILPFQHLDEVLAVNRDIIEKGCRVVYDPGAGGLAAKIGQLLASAPGDASQTMTEATVQAAVRDLLFHVIWSAKKLKRNELWVAVSCINAYMKNHLLTLVEAYNCSVSGSADPLRYNGRFLEQRTDPALLARLAGCFTRYQRAEAAETLQHILDLTRWLDEAICAQNGYRFDPAPFEQIRLMLAAILAEGPAR